MLPAMKAQILSKLKKHSTFSITQGFLDRLPGSDEIDFSQVWKYLLPIEEEILNRVEARNEKPDFKEFWTAARKIFKERVLDSFDRSIVPANELLNADHIDLEPYVAFWEYHHGKPTPIIEHVISGLTPEQLTSLLGCLLYTSRCV